MALGDAVITIAGLLQIDLPGGAIRLADGGIVKWGVDVFSGASSVWGTLIAADPGEEGLGDLAPASGLTFAPPAGATAASLADPSFQGSRVRMWMAEVNRATGEVTGTPDALFDGLIDVTTLRLEGKARLLDVEIVSRAERLFLLNRGNVASPRFHRSVWAGEAGFDNAVGVTVQIAWGVEAPPRGASGGFGGGFGGGGFDGGDYGRFKQFEDYR